MAQVTADMGRAQDDPLLGNLVTDAFRAATGADLAATDNGTLRADLVSGPPQVSDLFLVSPLGVGTLDASPSYAPVKAWLTAAACTPSCRRWGS